MNINKNGKYIYKNLFKLVIKGKFNFQRFNPNQSKKNINIYKREARNNILKFLAIRINIILKYLLKKFWVKDI